MFNLYKTNKYSVIIGIIFSIIFIVPIVAQNILSNQVKTIAISKLKDNSFSLSITLDGKKPKYKYFSLKKPERLVIDIKNTKIFPKKVKIIKTEDLYVKNVRVALKIKGSRAVLDFFNEFNVLNHKIVTIIPSKKYKIILKIQPHTLTKKLKENNKQYTNVDDIINDVVREYNIVVKTTSEKKIKQLTKSKQSKNHQATKNMNLAKRNNFVNSVNRQNIKNVSQTQSKGIFIKNKSRPVIVIDAGHGGKDSGALSKSGTQEKNITLAYAKELKRQLDRIRKYDVYLTRSSDIFLTLRKRVAIGRKHKADIFISIHADSAHNKKARGLAVYTLSSKGQKQEESKALNQGLNLVKKESEYDKNVKSLLLGLSQQYSIKESKTFAGVLTNELKSRVYIRKESHRSAAFVVLKGIDIPSALIELGFITNRTDERLLLSRRHKQKTVAGMVNAVNKYFTN